MKGFKFLALAAMMLVPLAACDEGEEGLIPPAVTGTIQGTVTVDGTGRSGIAVTLSTGQTTTTSATGTYSFTGVTEGAHTVSISGIAGDVTFPTTAGTAVIATQGQVATVNFAGTTLRTSNILGAVTANGQPVAGATVTATGGTPSETRTGNTNATGQYTITGLRAGSYQVTVSGLPATVACPAGQSPQTATLTAGNSASVNFTCASTVTSTVAGSVRVDGVVMGNVIVTLTPVGGGPAVVDTTDAAGNFSFANLQTGTFTVTVTPPTGTTFPATTGQVVITTPGSFTVNFTGATVRNSAIVGSVTSAGTALQGIIVTVTGGSRSWVDTTDASGQYGFAGLTAGTYTVTVSNVPNSTVITPMSQAVTLTDNQTQVVNFGGSPPSNGVVTGVLFLDRNGDGDVDDDDQQLRVANVQLTLRGPGIGEIRTTNTDTDGRYRFDGLPTGNYILEIAAIAPGRDPDLPANVAFTGAASRAITVTAGGTTTVNMPFTFSTQGVRAYVFLGREGTALRGVGVNGATVSLYQTQASAAAAAAGGPPAAGRIGAPRLTDAGAASFTFDRSLDVGPAGTAPDNIVFALVTSAGPDAFHVLSPGQSAITEIRYGSLDSLATSADTFDVLNTRLVMQFTAVGTDADAQIENNRPLSGWFAAMFINDTSSVAAQDTVTDATGRARFTDAIGVASLPDTFYFRLAGPGVQPTDANFFQTPLPQEADAIGSYLRVIHNGIRPSFDTVGAGFEIVTFRQSDVVVRVHHEQNDLGNVSTFEPGFDDFENVDNVLIRIERVSDAVCVFGCVGLGTAVPGAGTPTPGYIEATNLEIHTGRGGAAIPLRVIARTTLGTQVVLNEDTLALSAATLAGAPAGSAGNLFGGSDSVAVCALGGGATPMTATNAGGCSSFAHKYTNGTIQGVVRTGGGPAGSGGLNADGVRVWIQRGPLNALNVDATDPVRARNDTTVRVTGGAFVVSGLTEGQYIVTVMDTLSAAGDTIFGIAGLLDGPGATFRRGQRSDTIDIQGNADNDIVNFRAFSHNTSIAGVVVNDRDADATTLDPGEALAGVTIRLYRDNDGAATQPFSPDSLVATTTTDASGAYSFTRLRESFYLIQAVNPGPGGELILERFNADGSPDNVQITNTFTSPGTGPNYMVGTTSPSPLPRWNYDLNNSVNTDPTHFTFLYRNTTARATVTTAGGVAVPGMTVTLRRCLASAGSTSPPTAGACATDASFPPINMVTAANGIVDFAGLLEGVYEVRPQPTTAAGFSTVAPTSALYRLVGSGDVEAAIFIAAP